MKHALLALSTLLLAVPAFSQQQVTTKNGVVEGYPTADAKVISYKGLPFAQPPIGPLRWKEPQPVQNWTGVRKADHFGPRAMQKPIFGDMGFRSDGLSEDCLYLNVWAPAGAGKGKALPVLVYFYGGGLAAGDGSEPRYDGESMARRGIVAITVNYRLGIFGFFSHPELTKESPHHSSGNYGYLDQHAALEWVQQNIAAFGGDPKRVTIAGESAGSISVSVQMASPLSKDLIAGAIGESGAAINPTLYPIPLAEAEQNGVKLAGRIHVTTLDSLRALPAEKLLDAAFQPGAPGTDATIDGYLLPKSLPEIFATGEQAHVPLLAGWNSAEVPYQFIMGPLAPTPDNYKKVLDKLYGDRAADILKLYPGSTEEEVMRSATDLSSDRFIVYSTWKWADLHVQTSGQPVYRYLFSRMRPPMVDKDAVAGLAGGVIKGNGSKPAQPKAMGAGHASEIEYALGNLGSNKVYAWTPDDYKVSNTMESYFANFIKTGNPNGPGLTKWEAIRDNNRVSYIDIDVQTVLRKETKRARYLLLDGEYMQQ